MERNQIPSVNLPWFIAINRHENFANIGGHISWILNRFSLYEDLSGPLKIDSMLNKTFHISLWSPAMAKYLFFSCQVTEDLIKFEWKRFIRC